MFGFLRNLGRSEKDKQQEALNAYLDGELAPADRARFEQQLAQDSDLQDELAEMQFWQEQMRDLPARRVPRNFTLDPALYDRPQRQFLGNAYPALRTATALTAFLLVIALAANVYMSGFSTGAVQQAAMVADLEMAPAPKAEVEEAASEAFTQDDNVVVVEEMLVEEEVVVEREALPEALSDQAAAELPAEPPATPFALELSVDKETEAAEAPVEIGEAAEELPADVIIEEEALAEAAPGEGDEALPGEQREEPREELPSALESLALEIVEETAESPADGDPEFVPSIEEAAPPADAVGIEEAPLDAAVPEPQEQRLFTEPTPSMVETIPQPALLLPVGLDGIIYGLGLLFIFLIVLTLIARGRR